MKAAWKIGRIAGVEIHLHATFPLLFIWLAAAQYLQTGRWRDVAVSLVFTVLLFAIVVLHELGHALMARRFGIRTQDITLLPIGGMARLERMPERPRQEMLVALAGPAVNVALAALFALAVLATSGLAGLTAGANLVGGGFLARLAWVNIFLAAFNLLPAFPMDGGRVLRALLAMRLDYVQATNLAARIGHVFAVGLGLVGLLANPFLVLIAVFVWIGAAQEAEATQLKSTLAGLPVERVMMTEFHSLAPDDALQRAVDFVLASRQLDFPVLESRRLVGMLSRSDLLAGLAKDGVGARVGEVMQREYATALSTEKLEQVINRLGGNGRLHALAVMREGELAGLLTIENLGNYLLVQSALEHSHHDARPAH